MFGFQDFEVARKHNKKKTNYYYRYTITYLFFDFGTDSHVWNSFSLSQCRYVWSRRNKITVIAQNLSAETHFAEKQMRRRKHKKLYYPFFRIKKDEPTIHYSLVSRIH